MISLSGFGGVMPRENPALLPDKLAQTAKNCIFWHSDLRSLRAPADVASPASIGRTIRSIYRIGQEYDERQFWMAWGDDVDVVRGLIAADVSERTYYTGDGAPKVTNLTLATQGGGALPVTHYTLGIPKPASAVTLVPSSSTAPAQSRVYVATLVSEWGEEGPPSDPATIAVSESGTVTVSNLPAAPTGNYNIKHVRVYRSQNTATGSGVFRFVKELPIGTASFVDDIAGSALGETLSTIGFDAPPATLRGLIALANGSMVGFDGYDVLFSEPYLGYAWPRKYSLTMDYPVVGLGAFGSTVVVCTKGVPVLISGSHPSQTMPEKVDLKQACVSKRSIVSVDGGVIYASPDGLVFVGIGGAKVITDKLYTAPQWRALNPAGITAFYHEGKYIGFFESGGGFILNSWEEASLTFFDDAITGGYVDLISDGLYVVINNTIKKFNAGAELPYTWRSKQFQITGQKGYVAARVDANSYPVTANFYADGVLLHSEQVLDRRAFRLPVPDTRADQFELELTGTRPIRWVGVGRDMKELASAR